MRYGVCLFVRYRSHFPVVQFQNQTHIRNPHGTGSDLVLRRRPNFFYRRPEWGAPNIGRRGHPKFFICIYYIFIFYCR